MLFFSNICYFFLIYVIKIIILVFLIYVVKIIILVFLIYVVKIYFIHSSHYTNLQALLINDNTGKSNKLDWVHPKNGRQITFLRLIYNKFLTLPKLIV